MIILEIEESYRFINGRELVNLSRIYIVFKEVESLYLDG